MRAALERVTAAHDLGAAQSEALARYVDAVLGWRRSNVTGLTNAADVVDILIGDSLALLAAAQLRERARGVWLDLGAGAGIPGIPLAIACPTARLTLLDAAAKKCSFLEVAVDAAGLTDRATVVCDRSERYAAAGGPGRDVHDVVFARAVAQLAALVELSSPLLAQGGVLLASKTHAAMETEAVAAAAATERCGMRLEAVQPLPDSSLDDAVCVIVRKIAPSPRWLPRREGMASKRPIGG